MAITVEEKPESPRIAGLENAQVERLYWVEGTTDSAAAQLALLGATAETWGELTRVRYKVDATARTDLWDCSVSYGMANPAAASLPEVGDSVFSFDTTGGTQRITQALEHIGDYGLPWGGVPYPNPPEPMRPGGAINVNDDLEAEGTEVPAPVYRWAETHYLNPLIVTPAYRGIVRGLTGKVNAAAFKGNARGECMFFGATGSKRGTADWEIAFNFASIPNATGLVVGGITIPVKQGWWYLWFDYLREAVTDATSGKQYMRLTAKGAHVDRVADYGDFALLGIGVA